MPSKLFLLALFSILTHGFVLTPPKYTPVLLKNSPKTYEVPVLYEDKPFSTFIVKLFNGEKIWFRVNITDKIGHLKALIEKHYSIPNDKKPYNIQTDFPREPLDNLEMTILDADISAKQLSLK